MVPENHPRHLIGEFIQLRERWVDLVRRLIRQDRDRARSAPPGHNLPQDKRGGKRDCSGHGKAANPTVALSSSWAARSSTRLPVRRMVQLVRHDDARAGQIVSRVRFRRNDCVDGGDFRRSPLSSVRAVVVPSEVCAPDALGEQRLRLQQLIERKESCGTRSPGARSADDGVGHIESRLEHDRHLPGLGKEAQVGRLIGRREGKTTLGVSVVPADEVTPLEPQLVLQPRPRQSDRLQRAIAAQWMWSRQRRVGYHVPCVRVRANEQLANKESEPSFLRPGSNLLRDRPQNAEADESKVCLSLVTLRVLVYGVPEDGSIQRQRALAPERVLDGGLTQAAADLRRRWLTFGTAHLRGLS